MIDRINALAKKRGVSISTIEKNVGLSNGIIGKWKKQSPTCDKLKLVADYLEVSIDYLLTGEEHYNGTNISHSTIGAFGNHSHGTVMMNTDSTAKEVISKFNSNPEQNMSDITKEIVKISESLPMKEQVKLLSMIYDFEEQYKKSDT